MRYLRFDSIRTESSLAKSNRLTGNRLAVGNNRGYEIAAIRVDSHDSLRIAPAKSNHLTGSRLELGDNWGLKLKETRETLLASYYSNIITIEVYALLFDENCPNNLDFPIL